MSTLNLIEFWDAELIINEGAVEIGQLCNKFVANSIGLILLIWIQHSKF